MKTIIAGSRTIALYGMVENAIEACPFRAEITEVVSGGARGADAWGERWALLEGRVPVQQFPADWKRYGKRAGLIRNEQMADYADALIAVWDGESRGTAHMIREARARGLKVFVYDVRAELAS